MTKSKGERLEKNIEQRTLVAAHGHQSRQQRALFIQSVAPEVDKWNRPGRERTGAHGKAAGNTIADLFRLFRVEKKAQGV